MPTGLAINKDLKARFADVIPNMSTEVNINEVANVDMNVDGGTAQVWMPTDITLTPEDVASITGCVNNVTCYESGVAEFPLTKAVKESVVMPDCESKSISPRLMQQALERYLFSWNALLVNAVRVGVETNAVETTVAGTSALADIETIVQDLESTTGLDSTNFVVKVSAKVYNELKTPTTQTNIMAYDDTTLANYLGVAKIWKDNKAGADIVVYPKPFELLAGNCVSEPRLYSANGNPQYQGSSYVHGKMKYDAYSLTLGSYVEYAKVTTYSATAPASGTVRSTKK